MQNKLFAAIAMIMMVMIGMTGLAAATTYDSSVTLDNKDISWALTPGDGIGALINYCSSGDEFVWSATGIAPMEDTEYSLIYYADYTGDRFGEWGGDNPGALIGTFTTGSSGEIVASGSTDIGMNLPCSPDANMVEHDYSGEPDFYAHAHGAKLWMVPSVDYAMPMTAYHPTNYLFETDLITYTYTGNGFTPLGVYATISIGDAFVCDDGSVESIVMPIMISDANDVGSVYLTMYYDEDLVTVTGVTDGDMEVMEPYSPVAGQVNIITYQDNNPGLSGEFALAYIEFTPVEDGICDLDIEVTSFLDATQRAVGMPHVVSDGSLYINEYINGDVNYNGVVDSGDVMVLAKHIIGINGFENINECAADIDCDHDNIDTGDVVYLARHLLGVPGYPLPATCG